ncbi:MAG TPA: cupin domain-containing protein, partial [Actinomycetales bacterium]
MDPLTDLLSRARAEGSLFAHTTFHGRGGLRLGEEPAPLALHLVREGPLWLHAQGRVMQLAPGDVLLVRRGTPVSFTAGPDEDATPLAVLIAGLARAPGVQQLLVEGPGAPAGLVCGAYALSGSLCDRLIDVLPPVAHVPDAPGPLRHLVQSLQDEMDGAAPGQQTALDRLLDLLLVHVLRAHFASGAPVP